MEKFSIDSIIENPDEKIFDDFRKYVMNKRSPLFSRQLTDYLIHKSKVKNWPNGFTCKDLLIINKNHLKNLQSIKLLYLDFIVFKSYFYTNNNFIVGMYKLREKKIC